MSNKVININLEEYKEKTEKTLNQLFENAEEKNPEMFLRSLLALDEERFKIPYICYTSDYVFQELCDLLNDFHLILTNKDTDKEKIDKKNITRLRLFLYCHIIEAEFPYMIIANMARILAEEPYNTRIYRTDDKGEKIVCEYPIDKLSYIKELGKKIGFKLHKLWYDFFYKELRNSFVHSQYFLYENGNIELTPLISPTTDIKKESIKELFKYEEIGMLYLASYSFFETFFTISKHSRSKYQTGDCFPIGDNKRAKFDLIRKNWIPCESEGYFIKPIKF